MFVFWRGWGSIKQYGETEANWAWINRVLLNVISWFKIRLFSDILIKTNTIVDPYPSHLVYYNSTTQNLFYIIYIGYKLKSSNQKIKEIWFKFM